VEATQERIAGKRKEIEEIDENWRQEQSSLLREQSELMASLASMEQRRGELAARIDAASLELYQDLRQKRQGRAVAKVEQGMCQGCRLVLSMAELQRARISQELVQCSSCQRILYLS
jgi:predicted  nucleic acid-binding Zn-ribbon protein